MQLTRTRNGILLATVLSIAGCTTALEWRPLHPPIPAGRHDLVWIFSRGTAYTWQAVVISRDSVSGVPYDMPAKCDSCRHSLPLAQVDDMRLGYLTHPDAPRDILRGAGVLTLVVVASLIVELAVCTAVGARHGC